MPPDFANREAPNPHFDKVEGVDCPISCRNRASLGRSRGFGGLEPGFRTDYALAGRNFKGCSGGIERPADVAVHRRENMIQRGQSLIGVQLDGAQGMIRRHARLRRDIAEPMALGIDFTAHPGTTENKDTGICVCSVSLGGELMKGFSATCQDHTTEPCA